MILRNPIARAESAFNMKWQGKLCGAKSWQSSACFKGLNMTTDELTRDWVKRFKQQVESEMKIVEDCRQKLSVVEFGSFLMDCYDMRKSTAVNLHELIEDRFLLGRGIYIDQIMNWLRFYPANKLLVLSSSELNLKPTHELAHLFKFLEVDPEKANYSPVSYHHHVREYPWKDKPRELLEVEEKLRYFFMPFNEHLLEWMSNEGVPVGKFQRDLIEI
jgi:hypothetical protein